jgi:hypothetical protein
MAEAGVPLPAPDRLDAELDWMDDLDEVDQA